MRFSTQLKAVPPAANRLFRLCPIELERGEADRLTNYNRPRDPARPRTRLFQASRNLAALHFLPVPIYPLPFALGHVDGATFERDLYVREQGGGDCERTAGRTVADVDIDVDSV